MNKFPLYILSTLMLTSASVTAQIASGPISTQTKYGKYVAEKTTENIVGSPYLIDEWKPATIKMKSGLLVKEKIKYNLLDDQLYFKSSDDKFMTFAEPVSEFRIEEGPGAGLYKNGFDNSKFGSKNTFYQVLFDGKVKLLKRVNKGVNDVQEYNAASPTKTITQQVRYYTASADGALTEIKPSKKAILDLAGSKKDDLDKYISNFKPDFKKDQDLTSLFSHYNSLL